MKSDDAIIKRLVDESNNTAYNFLSENGLSLYFYDIGRISANSTISFETQIRYNKKLEAIRVKEILSINKELSSSGIIPVYFKGSLLARKLYGNKYYLRKIGDIDLWVCETDFDTALNILLSMGYSPLYPESVYDQHHAMLEGHCFVTELHRKILEPRMNLDESFLISNTEEVILENSKLITLSDTATFLHLIYHLYSDIMMNTGYNGFFINGRLLKLPERFEFRAYEIARFSELYYDSINWAEIISDISGQKLDILFYCFLKYINDIYGTFPTELVTAAKEIACSRIEDNELTYRYFISLDESSAYIQSLPLVKYLGSQWHGQYLNISKEPKSLYIDEYDNNKIQNKASYVIDGKKPVSSDDLSFKFEYSYNKDLIDFKLYITDDTVIFADKSFDSYRCDCIGLIFVSTNPYDFRQIFIFPMNDNGELKCVVRDMNTKKNFPEKLISADVFMTERGYIISAQICKEFFSDKGDIYFDLLICDCDEEGEIKKTTMNIFGNEKNWWDVTFYSKIRLLSRS